MLYVVIVFDFNSRNIRCLFVVTVVRVVMAVVMMRAAMTTVGLVNAGHRIHKVFFLMSMLLQALRQRHVTKRE